MRRIVWLPQAQMDLAEIDTYLLSVAGSDVAVRVLDRVMTAAALLANYPALGTPSPVDDDVRELVVAGATYLLPYRVHPGRIEILRVFHDAQHRPGSWQA